MAGEIITANTLEEAKKQLRNIYRAKNNKFEEITKEDYNSIEADEREDSDNHINEERLGKESEIIDLAYYKYLPGNSRKTAYYIMLKHQDGSTMEDFFMVTPEFAPEN